MPDTEKREVGLSIELGVAGKAVARVELRVTGKSKSNEVAPASSDESRAAIGLYFVIRGLVLWLRHQFCIKDQAKAAASSAAPWCSNPYPTG
jgi:hypothetical protein